MRVSVNSADGTWLWADYGGSPKSGKKVDGGGCLDMVCRLGNFSSYKDALKELERIAESRGMAVIEEESRVERKRAQKPTGIVLDSSGALFTRRALVRYAKEVRGIPEDILSRYCCQVTYHPRSKEGSQFTVIGFPNNEGGYALRGTGAASKSKFKSKFSTASGITTIKADGSFSPKGGVSSDKCLLFEGFMDFMSYLVWKGVVVPGDADVCVLNSTSMVSYSRSWVESHSKVRTFFDNDKAGSKATEEVQSWCTGKGLDFKDGRSAYKGYKDLNEAWTAELERRRQVRERKAAKSTGKKIK